MVQKLKLISIHFGIVDLFLHWISIELKLEIVGDQPIIQREMEGSDEGEVSLKELKDTVLLLAKQLGLWLESPESCHLTWLARQLHQSLGWCQEIEI